MAAKRYFKLTKRELEACSTIRALAPFYGINVDFDLFPSNPVYTRKIAAIMIGCIGGDLRSMAVTSLPGRLDAGFGPLSYSIKKITALL